MSEDFLTISPDTISEYLEGFLSEESEKEVLLKVNTIEDLWMLARMKSQK